MMKRRLKGSLLATVVAFGLVLGAGVGSASAYTAIMFVDHLRFTANGTYLGTQGTHSGGSVHIVVAQGSQQLRLLQGSGVLAEISGGTNAYTKLEVLAAANTRVQCKWTYSGPSIGQPYGYCERFV